MAEKIKLSLIVPCFNEEKRLLVNFLKVYNFIEKKLKSFELILVNDGSRDRTEEIIKTLSKKYKKVSYLTYSTNKGKGYAVKLGVSSAKGEVIGFTDADFAISLKQLPQTISLFSGGADIVIGDRKSSKSVIENESNLLRRLLSQIHSRSFNFFLNMGTIYDTLCGYKFFKREVAKKLFKSLETYNWFFDLEILMKARKDSLKIAQVPVVWREISNSKVRVFSDFPKLLINYLAIFWKFLNLKIVTAFFLVLMVIILTPFLLNPDSLVLRNGDFSDLVWPDYFFIKQSFLSFNQLPLWNPTLFSGIPEIANPQSPLIYFPNLLALILPLNISIVLLILLHGLMAAIFTFKTTFQSLKWSKSASLMAAFVFVFSPYFWSKVSVGHISQFFAFMLLPAILYILVKFLESKNKKLIPILGILLSLQYLNYPTIWYYTAFFGLIGAIILSLSDRKYDRIVYLILALGFSVIFILPIFLLQIQAGSLITRSQLSLTDLALPLWSIRRFVTSILVPSNFLQDNETEVWLYPSIILITCAVYGWWKSNKRYKLISLFFLIAAFFITLGLRTPFFSILLKTVPGFSFLRVTTRVWFIVIVTFSFLAAFSFNFFKGLEKKIFILLLVADTFIFSAARLWFIPHVMQPYTNIDFSSLLQKDEFRYYCTKRCLSARDTLTEGLITADGYHLLILKNYRNAISFAGGFAPPKYTGNIPIYDGIKSQPSAKELGEFAVKWVVSDYQLIDQGFVKVKRVNNYWLYRNKLAKERFRFKDQKLNSIKIVLDSPNLIKLETSGKQDKLVVADSYYPGWEVWVDDRLGIINLENGWARSVKLDKGDHKVTFKYLPFNHLFK